MSPLTSSFLANGPRQRRFLYVEDFPSMRELMEVVLAGDGHALTCAANGLEALELVVAEPHSFDFVITDHDMPVMNGVELVTALRSIGFRGRILVLSAALTPETEEAYAGLRVDCVLAKPVPPLVLRTVISTL
ncbi:MAG TPA: response regulator [Opitutaceae bacterium]|nr:response regulator [Opitutaceae bacterium]HRJ47512.1 response regulator [Opitutaceae bacterium]